MLRQKFQVGLVTFNDSLLKFMPIYSLESAAQRFAIESVNLYQQHISPYKGYSCSYRLLHQGQSCSAVVKQALLTESLVQAIATSREQFRACAAASRILRSRTQGGCIVIPCCIPL